MLRESPVSSWRRTRRPPAQSRTCKRGHRPPRTTHLRPSRPRGRRAAGQARGCPSAAGPGTRPAGPAPGPAHPADPGQGQRRPPPQGSPRAVQEDLVGEADPPPTVAPPPKKSFGVRVGRASQQCWQGCRADRNHKWDARKQRVPKDGGGEGGWCQPPQESILGSRLILAPCPKKPENGGEKKQIEETSPGDYPQSPTRPWVRPRLPTLGGSPLIADIWGVAGHPGGRPCGGPGRPSHGRRGGRPGRGRGRPGPGDGRPGRGPRRAVLCSAYESKPLFERRRLRNGSDLGGPRREDAAWFCV